MLTPTQKVLMRWGTTPAPLAPRVAVATGSFRSGKTRGGVNVAYAHSKLWPGGYRPLVGKTREVANRNMAGRLAEIARADGYIIEPKETAERYKTGPSAWAMVGAPTSATQDVLQGGTIAFGLLDEGGLLPERVVKQALGRLSSERSKLLITLNPESPAHWLNEYLIERDVPVLRLHVPLAENHAISRDTRDFYDAVFDGVDHDRYVKGEWTSRYGLMYPDPFFCDPPPAQPAEVGVGIDFGSATPTAAVWFARYQAQPDLFYAIDEYSHGPGDGPARTIGQHVDAILARWRLHTQPVIDPSAHALRIEFTDRGVVALKGRNDVVWGVDQVNAAFSARRLAVASSCPRLRRQMAVVEWDETAAERGESKQVKRNDHLVDAMRYWGSLRLAGVASAPRAMPEVLRWR